MKQSIIFCEQINRLNWNICFNLFILVGHSACSNMERRVIQDHQLNKVIQSNEYKDALELFENQRLEAKEMIEVMKIRKVLKRMKRKAPVKCHRMLSI